MFPFVCNKLVDNAASDLSIIQNCIAETYSISSFLNGSIRLVGQDTEYLP